ncbi:MAG: OmpH family outer membrane protein [Flavobacteriaceae bacterium]|nr:OmpH family outer membrane protein [Flavobacteriaceae bacterium]
MKKLLVVFSVFLLLASCNPIKITYVDIEEIIKEYEGSKEAEKEMKAESEKMAAELDQLAMSFQQKVQEYQSNSKDLSDTAKKEKEQVLMQEQQMIQQRQQMAQQQVQVEGQKMMGKINEEIETFLSEYAKTNGYSYILGTSNQTKSVYYGDATLNITEAVITALNEGYNPEKEVDKAEAVLKEEPVN